MAEHVVSKKKLFLIVLVASLGYFIDVYDIIVFSMVRIQSLTSLGFTGEELRIKGEYILNSQMAGLFIGSLIAGVLGDKLGRMKILFASILMYSIANFANGYVVEIATFFGSENSVVDFYAVIRFLAGLGLAGELGVGITLVSETMEEGKRGIGTMIVATIGLLGAAGAYFVSELVGEHWEYAFIVGGVLGFLLLLLRVGVVESGMFEKTKKEGEVALGQLKMLFTNKRRFMKYVYCLLLGIPVWLVLGIFATQSPEIGKELGAVEAIKAGPIVMLAYVGMSVGDILSSLLAQWIKSRKWSIFAFQFLTIIGCLYFLLSTDHTQADYNWMSFFMGIGIGYWATFITFTTEQFGTNLRSTVTTTAPNVARGALIPITFLFEFFNRQLGLGIVNAGIIMTFVTVGIGMFALTKLDKGFGKSLDFYEVDE